MLPDRQGCEDSGQKQFHLEVSQLCWEERRSSGFSARASRVEGECVDAGARLPDPRSLFHLLPSDLVLSSVKAVADRIHLVGL